MKVVSQGRSELPQGLAYPLSLKTISEVVADAEVDADLRVCFMQNKKVKKSPKARRKYRDSSSDILVASYEYQPVSLITPNRMIGDSHYSYAAPVWDLRVFAVDVSQLKEIKDLLHEEGLPRFRDWLQVAICHGQEFGHDTLYVGCKEGRILFEQSTSFNSIFER
ncbi:MAG: hypothetical protein H6677_04920 [Candidatus Obscuribacterales bacterium]|nr:hypothetical protein [Cyanobacteria bacterium HKST-UBA01]MCB9467601.1 hypothetical protein [Candidatus Obscuribacterales bacterium]